MMTVSVLSPPTTVHGANVRGALPLLVAAVADHLPGRWELVAPPLPFVCLTQGDFELSFKFVGDGTRVRVTGYPPHGYHRCTRLTPRVITASTARGGAHIASHITRRLMPGYRDDVATAKRELEREADRLERYRGAAERVRELVPDVDAWSARTPDTTVFRRQTGFRFDYRLLKGGECNVDLEYLPEQVALEVIALIADRLGLTAQPTSHTRPK